MAAVLKDVAARAGVSIKTVSNVIHDFPFVRPETRARVQAAIDELGYQPNQSARMLRTGRSGMIALSVPEMTPYFSELAELIVDAAERAGWRVLIDRTGGERQHERWATHRIPHQLIDGLIASPLQMRSSDLPTMAGAGTSSVPVVLLGERLSHVGADHVAVDNVAASAEAVRHLADSGRTRIAAIGAQARHVGASAQRLRGYYQALEEVGIARVDDLVAGAVEYHSNDGYAAMVQLLAADPAPDAVFCFNDLLALGALRAIADAGLRVPDDIAVVGFDDVDACRFCTPRLSSIRPDKSVIAETAVRMLQDRINGTRHEPEDITAPHSLVVRQSSARGAAEPAG